MVLRRVREAIGSIMVVIVAVPGLSACGGDDAKPSATATPLGTLTVGQTDVCPLLTFSEVSAALGETIADRAATTPPVRQEIAPALEADLSACQYSSPSSGAFVELDRSEAKRQVANIKEFTEGVCASKDEIAGLGDFACWYSFDHGEIKLAKNGAHVDIKSGTASGDTLLSLANKVVGRLP
jgi:hypothetical protein